MTDSENLLICPACGKQMKKFAVDKKGFHLDICVDGCGGIWFDNRELKYFDESSEDIEMIKQALLEKSFESVNSPVTRMCPVCNVKMVKNPTGATGKVQIDECYTCGGKFFDYNEILGMREEYKTDKEREEAALDMFNSLYSSEINEHTQKMKMVKPSSGKRLFDCATKDFMNFVFYNM